MINIKSIRQIDYPNDVTVLEIPCPQCGKTSVLTLSTKVWLKGLKAYKNGTKVQDAWPTIPPAGRELFITGICERCWDEKSDVLIFTAYKKTQWRTEMNARDKVIEMVEDGLLDWEMVARECLARMSTDDCQDMVDECDWEGPQA